MDGWDVWCGVDDSNNRIVCERNLPGCGEVRLMYNIHASWWKLFQIVWVWGELIFATSSNTK